MKPKDFETLGLEVKERVCKYCGRTFYVDDITYTINPFCSKCLMDRMMKDSPKKVKYVCDFSLGYGVIVPE